MPGRRLPAKRYRGCDGVSQWPANYPWHAYSWLGHGHTFPCDAIPRGPDNMPFPFVLLQNAAGADIPVVLPDYRDDPVMLLWLLPITEQEQDFAESQGSERLVSALAKEQVGTLYRRRREVEFGGR